MPKGPGSRIAGMVPQRASDLDGDLWWLHTCGCATYGDGDDVPEICPRTSCFLDGKWRALYTLEGS